MDVLIYVLSFLLLVGGIAGCVLPILPGPPLGYAGLLLLHFTGRADFSTTQLVTWLIIVIILQVVDFVTPLLGSKYTGGTSFGNRGCVAGTLIGMFFLPWGIIVGPFIGAVAGEMLGGSDLAHAIRAGIGSLISRVGMPLCFGAVMAFHKEWKQYLRMTWERFSWQRIHELAKIGFPIGGQTLLETFLFTASFVIIGWISKEALAAHQIANQIADMTFMLALGIGSATTIRVSHQLGEDNIHGVRMASTASVHLVLLMNTIGATLMISLRNYIPMLFTEDTEVIAIASQLIVLAGLFQYADGLQAVGAAMLRGITDVKVPMMIAFVSYILIGLSVGLVCAFPLGMGASGIWIGFIFALAIAAICFHIRFNRKLKALH